MIKNIVVLFSGSGTNLENIIKTIHLKTFNSIQINIVQAITNNPNAGGIKICEENEIPYKIINHKDFNTRDDFDDFLAKHILTLEPDLVVLAGFMRILGNEFTSKINNAINLHPSLLPLFKGANAIQDTYEAGSKMGGVTLHYVSEELDGGEIIDQISCEVSPSFYEFFSNIRLLEYKILRTNIIQLLTN